MDWSTIVNQLGPALLSMVAVLAPVIIILLRQAANAQTIVNKNYDQAMTRLTEVEKNNKDLQARLTAIQVEYAGEKGGLTQQVKNLEDSLSRERSTGETRSAENSRAIGALEGQLKLLTDAQKNLEDRIVERTKERDALQADLKKTREELVQVRERELILTDQVRELTQQLSKVNSELQVLQQQMNGPV